MNHAIPIIVVARNSIVREGLCRILTDNEFRVVETARSVEEIHSEAEDLGPTPIIIADCSGSDLEGADLAEIKCRLPNARTIVLTDTFDFNSMLSALREGAHGLIISDISCESLIGTINLVAMGEKVLPSQLADNLPSYLPQVERECEMTLQRLKLSPQEVAILRCLTMGYPNKVVSRYLDISEIRVKAHVKAVLRKISVTNRTQAAIWAANNGLAALEFPAARDTPMFSQMASAAAPEAVGQVPLPAGALFAGVQAAAR